MIAMRGRRYLPVLCAFAAAFAQQAGQQSPPAAPEKAAEPAPQHRINVSVSEVIVPVTVTDDKGRFVSNLEEKDFRVFQDGREQKIIYFNREHNQPVVVGFLLDLSNSSRRHWKQFQDSAMELVWNLFAEDRAKTYKGFLVTYGNEPELAVNTTSDGDSISEKIRTLKPGGGSSLFDAIYMAITKHQLVMGEPIEPRRVLVIIGDGNDNNSKHTLEQVIELAQRHLVTVYCVSTSAYGFQNTGEVNLVRLAEETGGRVEHPLEDVYKDVSGYLSTPSDDGNYALKVGTGAYAAAVAKGMFTSIANVSGEVTTQYILRYIPADTDSARQYHTIRVEVKLPDVKVRARKGYYPYAP
jgi:VWFA-related protein